MRPVATLERKVSSAPARLRRHRRELISLGAVLRDRFDRRWQTMGGEPLRLVVPLGPNDVEMVELTLDAARRNIRDELRSITVVCPGSVVDDLPYLGDEVIVVDEVDLLGTELIGRIHAAGGGGWIVQQLIKLSADKLGNDLPILCLDADTVLVTPQVFLEGDRVGRFVVNEQIASYYEHLERVFGDTVDPSWISYVAHQMVFEPTVLVELRSAIEALHPGRCWEETIIDAIDPAIRQGFGMSEFELYGHFNHGTRHRPLVHRAFFNRPLLRSDLASVEDLEARWGDRFRSVSFHSYMRSGHLDRLIGDGRWHARDRRFQKVTDG